VPERLGFLGGTGPEGRGLAARFALADHDIVIGSRDAGRAADAAARVTGRLDGRDGCGAVTGAANREAAQLADVVFLAVPYSGQAGVLSDLASVLDGKICVSLVAPLTFEDGRPRAAPPRAGSAAEEAATQAPGVRWVAGLHTLSARDLWRVSTPLDTDGLVCGDDEDAKRDVLALVGRIEGLRAVDAGPLECARYLEGATALLLNINRVHKAHASMRIVGL
jgi:hypothetical protein